MKKILIIDDDKEFVEIIKQILETNDFLSHISKKITTNDYSMLTMKYLDGYSHSEIAKQFNCSENKISNRINYTKNKIKKGRK